MPLSPLLEKLLAGHTPGNMNPTEMLQENLKDQRDSVKKGQRYSLNWSCHFDREFLSENLIPLSSCTFLKLKYVLA